MSPTYDNRNKRARGAHASHAKRPRGNANQPRNLQRHRAPAPRRRNLRPLAFFAGAVVTVALIVVAGWLMLGNASKTGGESATTFEKTAASAIAATGTTVSNVVEQAAPIYRELGEATANIAAKGCQVGYYLGTVEGEQLEAYNADTVFYGASSIKGPFVLAELSAGASLSSQLGNVTNAIENSDNQAYYLLRNAWGFDQLNAWLTEEGVDMTTNTTSYAYYSARQLAGLWVKGWDYLQQDTDDTATIDTIFSAPLNSTFNTLGADETWSKPGWISGSLNSTVDAGLVKYGDNVYVISVMTSAGEDFEDVATIVAALDKLAVLDSELLA